MTENTIYVNSEIIQEGILKLNSLSEDNTVTTKIADINGLLDNNSGGTEDTLRKINEQLLLIDESMKMLILSTADMLNAVSSEFASVDNACASVVEASIVGVGMIGASTDGEK